jgi:hypothetical protein
VTQILQFEEKRVKKRMSGAKLLDKLKSIGFELFRLFEFAVA